MNFFPNLIKIIGQKKESQKTGENIRDIISKRWENLGEKQEI